ncbi:STAS domain-containing protein, partial [Ruegeria sp.]|uniref:STAS domain-containing protein n=1 Tax=Ruegeria sp. TaxID=1879320 RepID=UPI00230CC29A
MTRPTITSDSNATGICIRIAGDLLTQSLELVEDGFRSVKPATGPVELDLSQVQALDTGGAWLISDLQNRLTAGGATVQITGAQPAYATLIDTVARNVPKEVSDPEPPGGFVNWVAHLGARMAGGWKDTLSILEFLGLTLHRLVR